MAVAQKKGTTRGRTAQRGATTTTTRQRAPRKRATTGERADKTTHKTATLPVPVITPHMTVHKIHVPAPPRLPVGGHEVVDAGKAVTSFLPPPDRLAYYAGLGALAVAGVLEWPVAAAIGVGVVVARRAGRSAERPPWQSQKEEQEDAAREEKRPARSRGASSHR